MHCRVCSTSTFYKQDTCTMFNKESYVFCYIHPLLVYELYMNMRGRKIN